MAESRYASSPRTPSGETRGGDWSGVRVATITRAPRARRRPAISAPELPASLPPRRSPPPARTTPRRPLSPSRLRVRIYPFTSSAFFTKSTNCSRVIVCANPAGITDNPCFSLLATFAIGTFVPVILFWAFAAMVRQSHEAHAANFAAGNFSRGAAAFVARSGGR